MRLVCPISDSSVPHYTVLSHMRLLCPHETALFHMRLLCPILDWSVSHQTSLSYMRLFVTYQIALSHISVLSHMRLVCPISDRTSALSHLRLLCPIWDCSVHMRLLCPTWDCFKSKAQRFLYFLSSFVFLLLSWDWFVHLETEVWDGTGT